MFSILLGSGSPRRAAILSGMSMVFERRPVDIDETPLAGEAPLTYVRRLAETKAKCTADRYGEARSLCIGADTIVVLRNEILGKPDDPAEAVNMLGRLSGQTHQVITAVALVTPNGDSHVFHEETSVVFRSLSEEEIKAYVDTGSPLDKAGAYGIQDDASCFVQALHGSFSNVVGLPVESLVKQFARLGVIESGVRERLLTIRGRMAAAAPKHDVQATLIGASKGQPVAAVEALRRMGVDDFGESYVQEWEAKCGQLAEQPIWHFMGRIQSNKLKRIVSKAAMIHTVSSAKQLRIIDRHARDMGKSIACLIQVNIGGESSKGGVTSKELGALVFEANGLKNVQCLGLMTLPPKGDFAQTRAYFGCLKALGDEYFADLERPHLSMGMSGDLEIALSQGATMIRVGTALFGPRQ